MEDGVGGNRHYTSCPVMPTSARELGNLGLNTRPGITGVSGTGIENDRGTALARAVDIQTPSANIN